MKPATARPLASVTILGCFLPLAFFHLVFLWVVRLPHTAIESGDPSWPLLTLSAATAFFSLLPLLLAVALFSLLRRAYPSLRRGLKAWLFPPALLLALPLLLSRLLRRPPTLSRPLSLLLLSLYSLYAFSLF